MRPAGGLRTVDALAVPVLDDSQQLTYIGTVIDVTEEVETRRQQDELKARLHASERLESLGQLAGGVAHDFNNLLGAMLSYADFVSSDLDELAASGTTPVLAQMHDDVEAIRTAIGRASDLTRQLLIFGRREVIHPVALDVNEVIRDTGNLLARTIGEQIALRSRLASGLRPVAAERGHLEQVIVNLAVNARDAIADTGTVLISTDNVDVDEQFAALPAGAAPGCYARITVTDDGAGMTPETLRRACEPFFTTKLQGCGAVKLTVGCSPWNR